MDIRHKNDDLHIEPLVVEDIVVPQPIFTSH